MEAPAPPSHKQIWLEYTDRRNRFSRIKLKSSPKLGRYKKRIVAKGLYWAIIKIDHCGHFLQLVIHPEASEADIEQAVNAFLKLVNGQLIRWYY